MPIFVGNSIVNTAVANSTITVDQTQNFAYATSNRNSIRPSLNLDFTRSQTVDPRITFTRASSGTYFNSRGVLTTAATNIPRIDYNPITGACNGLLIEKESTNLIKNNTMVGAVLSASIAAQTISSITFSGTTATVTTLAPHGLSTISGIIMSGAAPSDYNGTYAVQSVVNPTTYTYTMRTTPATNATVVGSYTASSFGVWPNFWAQFARNSGVPYQIIGTGTSNGISYVDVRYYGVPNAATGAYSVICMNWDSSIAVSVTAGTQYTSGFYCSIVGGSTAGVSLIGIDTRWDVGEVSTTNIISSLTSTLTRFSATATAPSGASKVYPSFALIYTDNVAVDITIRFGLPQFELGTAATSVITTTAATATRAADVASILIGTLFNPNAFTVYTENIMANITPSEYPRILAINNGSSVVNGIQILTTPTSNPPVRLYGVIGSTGSFPESGNSVLLYTANAIVEGALSVSSNNAYITWNGATPVANNVAFGTYIPSSFTTLWISAPTSITGANTYCGWTRRIVLWTQALSNAELQTLTS